MMAVRALDLDFLGTTRARARIGPLLLAAGIVALGAVLWRDGCSRTRRHSCINASVTRGVSCNARCRRTGPDARPQAAALEVNTR